MKRITSLTLIFFLTVSVLSSCFFRAGQITSSSSEGTSNTTISTEAQPTETTTEKITTEEITTDEITTDEITTEETTTPEITTEVFPPQVDFSAVSEAINGVKAVNAFVFDVTDDKLLAIKGEGTNICPASVTKLLSILYALSVAPESLEITPKQQELDMVGSGSSIAYIKTHHRLTVAQLIKGMLLPSGNDAAYALAAGVGRYVANDPSMSGADAVALFMRGVNDYAAALGCNGTSFTVPDGLAGNEHYTSSHDLILIGKAVLENELIMSYTKIVSERVRYASGHTITWNNTNRLINPKDSYYSPYVTGLKTGSLTDNYCLYVSAEIEGHTYLIGIFQSPTKNSRYDDAHMLLDAILQL